MAHSISHSNITNNSVKLDVVGEYTYLQYFFKKTVSTSGSMGMGNINSSPFTLPTIDNDIRYSYISTLNSIVFNGLEQNTTYYYEVYFLNSSYQVIMDNGVMRTSFGSFSTTNSGGGGAGSDPYITTFSGEIYELPHVNKWWNLFTDKSTNFSIYAHSHNYKSGNFFNKVKIEYNSSIVNIDFDKKKISTKNNDDNIEIKKAKLNIKYQNSEIISDKQVYEIVSIKHPEFKTVDIVINWRNHYIHPNFGHLPIKNYSGLLIRPISKKSII